MNINWQPENLQCEKLRLIPLKKEHFAALFAVAADELIWEQHPAKDRYQEAVFREYFTAALESETAFVIFDKISAAIIGSTRFYEYDAVHSSVAVGYTFLTRIHWGTKTNRLVKKLMLDYAFQYVEKVIFHIGDQNFRSQKAVEKLGAKLSDSDFETSIKDRLIFVLNRSDWNDS